MMNMLLTEEHLYTFTRILLLLTCYSILVSVQLLSRVWLFATPWTAACQASLSITNSCSLLKLMSVDSVMPSNHLILCHPLLLLPSIFPSIRVFSNESALPIRWPMYRSFSFSISPMNTQDWCPLDGLVGCLCSPRDSQESSPTPQFKSISSLGLSFLYLELMTEETDRTGSILKAGLHLGPGRGLWAICPVSMETTYQLENQTNPAPHPPWKSPRACT